MEKLIALILGLTAATLVAQTNTPPPAPTNSASFYDTVQNWIINPNPDNAWTNKTRGTLNAGVATMQKSEASLCNEIRLTYDIYKNLSLEATTRDSGIAGTFVSGQVGFGYGIKVIDVKLTPYVNGGRDFVNEDKWFGEAGLRAEKRMTKWTHIGIGVGNQFPANRQVFSSWVGFSF